MSSLGALFKCSLNIIKMCDLTFEGHFQDIIGFHYSVIGVGISSLSVGLNLPYQSNTISFITSPKL